jgi:integrase
MAASYIKRKGLTYYVHRRVPKHIQHLIGSKQVVRSCRTRDRKIAERVKWAILSEIEDEFTAAEAKLTGNDPETRELIAAARKVRRQFDTGKIDEETLDVLRDTTLEIFERTLRPKRNAKGHPVLPEGIDRAVTTASRLMNPHAGVLLSEVIEQYTDGLRKRAVPSTVNTTQRRSKELLGFLGDREVAKVTKRDCARYVEEALLPKGLAPRTARDTVGTFHAIFEEALDRDLVERNVWHGLSKLIKAPRRGTTEGQRRPWTEQELKKMLTGIPADTPVWSLAVLALYTGARLTELTELELEDVNSSSIYIREGKTSNAPRRIPLPKVIRPLITGLRQESADGGEDNKRGYATSKQFGSRIRALGLTDRGLVFHSLRNCYHSAAEEAGIPIHTIDLLTGHSRQGMTLAVYSKGPSFEKLLKEVEKISYGSIDKLVQSKLEEATG